MLAKLMHTLADLPPVLLERSQWVAWKLEERNGRPTKLPVSPGTGRLAATDRPDTWGTFEEACARAGADALTGVGFVFTASDPFCGIDLDKCIDKTGELEPFAERIVTALHSYTEVSPSGTGLHILVNGKLPNRGRHKDRIEMYDSRRFFCMTGRHLPGTPTVIVDRQAELQKLHAEVFGDFDVSENKARCQSLAPCSLSDEELIRRASSARNSAKFSRLWAGDWQGAGYTSQSEADAALCANLAFWTRSDAARIDSLFRQSGLFRGKWDEPRYADGQTYGAGTIQHVLTRAGDSYNGYPSHGPRQYEEPSANEMTSQQWPTLDPHALYGIMGDVVRAIEPHSEADPVALLVQGLVAFGNTLNRTAYFRAESDHHFMNLFARARRGNLKRPERNILGSYPENFSACGSSMGRYTRIIRLVLWGRPNLGCAR